MGLWKFIENVYWMLDKHGRRIQANQRAYEKRNLSNEELKDKILSKDTNFYQKAGANSLLEKRMKTKK
ncbi:hypothetical protein SAMN05216582_1022 [Selenomonas ruminantium]|uniref:Uncharacterized protein n=1 Tax=Selenomonas ruminantium TaxID=971 RepID=A0A1M6RDH4_SELRU|nr:hypothetical protein [Selenomonas ruminantium]SHK30493.1 hypothetical protein SAMN05216582_1022 [Selenomonas ruminantium]